MNFNDFSNAWSAVLSRSFMLRTQLWGYANQLRYDPKEKQFQVIEKYFKSNPGFFFYFLDEACAALFPVFDIPNHRNPPPVKKNSQKPSFEIIGEPGFYTLSSDLEYKKGEEFAYTYTEHFFNAHLVENYGFATRENHGDFVDLWITNPMLNMSASQHRFCRIYGCLDAMKGSPIKETDEKLLYRLFQSHIPNKRLLSLYR